MVWTECSLKEKRNCAIFQGSFQEEVSTDLFKMPSQMEHAMETMMLTFHRFAGDKDYLTKEDLRVLMEREFPGFLENQKDPLAVDKIMKDLDQCRDGKVGFQSFLSLVAGLIIACNDYFVVHMKQKGKKFSRQLYSLAISTLLIHRERASSFTIPPSLKKKPSCKKL
ncbi:EF-HAND 2 containing protein [Cricetulus griseus]|uniref:Protein S100-A10 n=1 Tax=Cricetulus griseus TaxID=10029 RepID=A0A061ILN9_CRIGR|nr:EF-HAND 2 containing protein [Cricetulus griseus]